MHSATPALAKLMLKSNTRLEACAFSYVTTGAELMLRYSIPDAKGTGDSQACGNERNRSAQHLESEAVLIPGRRLNSLSQVRLLTNPFLHTVGRNGSTDYSRERQK